MMSKWLVTYVRAKNPRKPAAEFFESAGEAWTFYDTVEGSDIAIYRKKRVAAGGTRPARVEWELMEFHGARITRKAAA